MHPADYEAGPELDSRSSLSNMKATENEVKAIMLEDTARGAIDGDRETLEMLVRALQGDIYRR